MDRERYLEIRAKAKAIMAEQQQEATSVPASAKGDTMIVFDTPEQFLEFLNKPDDADPEKPVKEG